MKKILVLTILVFCMGNVIAKKQSSCKFEKQIEEFNYVIGTQTVGAKYKFTNETNLVETAKAIREMGSNLLKMSMSPRYWWENYDIPKNENIKSLTDLAKEKNMQQVLNMNFKYYQIWTYEFSQYTPEPAGQKKDENQIQFVNGLSDYDSIRCYKEIYEFSAYLLKTYSGTGKVFLLGNWEGDWHLRWDYDRTKPANPKTIEGMTRWFRVRQKAIEDAKSNIPHKNVSLFYYVEVNLSDLAVKGKDCLINSILPNINPDYVSFSSYTATNPPKNESEMDSTLTAHLNYIESKMKPKPEIKGKRLFIGEYGWSEIGSYSNEPTHRSPESINERAKWVMKSALKWGCPYILWWEMYNNELTKDGKNKGFWLINDKGEKTPLYSTHQKFYSESKEYLKMYSKKHGKLPTHEQFMKAAVYFNALK
jgi:hypothetical protein